MSKYLSVAETAKLLRQSLKESFPGVSFSVRSKSYSGGASITVHWTDGPTAKMVEQVTGSFEGAYFDGMIDYKGSRYHRLDGEEVHFGADFIFENRSHSDDALKDEIAIQCTRWGVSGSLEQYKVGDLWRVKTDELGYNDLQSEVNKGLAETSFYPPSGVKPSPTLARIGFAGDDGYGAGTVGRDGKGGEKAYSAMEAARERQRLLATDNVRPAEILAAAQGCAP